MDHFKPEDMRKLLSEHRGPCVSIFVPTPREEGEGGAIRWRRCVGQAVKGLTARGMSESDANNMLQPCRELLDDKAFWRGTSAGLGMFRSEGFEAEYRFPMTFTERVFVGRHFLITPLLPLLTNNGTFYVLALSQKDVRLLQGTKETVHQIELPGVPKSIEEALATHDVDNVLTFHTRPAGGIGSWGAIFSGHGVGIDDHKDDLLRYFQQINRGLHPVLKGERIPLVVAAVDYLHPIFERACAYAGLWAEGISGNPDRMSNKELHQLAWQLLEPAFRQKQENAQARYRQLAGTGRTACGSSVLSAACRGEIETLFVAQNHPVWGQIDPVTGEVECHEPEMGGSEIDEDVVNAAAVHTLVHGGEVYALPAEQMPNGCMASGIYWLPLAKHSRGKE